jgi:hypothetical protein
MSDRLSVRNRNTGALFWLLSLVVADAGAVPAWVTQSDANAQILIQATGRFEPEQASQLGAAKFDADVLDLGPDLEARRQAALANAQEQLRGRLAAATDPRVRQDLEILLKAAAEQADSNALEQRYLVPYFDAPQLIFAGINSLLREQITPQRRSRALMRLRRYAGLEPGSAPLLELAAERTRRGLTRPDLLAPSKAEVEKHVGNAGYYLDGIAELFSAYGIAGSEPAQQLLKQQFEAYRAFLTDTVLLRARDDFRLPPELYAFRLRQVGVDIPPEALASRARASWLEIRQQLAALAPLVAREQNLQATDYRDVLRALKQRQLTGEAILPFYEKRLAEIEAIVRREQIVTLPTRPARVRLASAGESAAVPAPFLEPSDLIGRSGVLPAFVLPLSVPDASETGALQRHDDFTYDAASWPLAVHEARPGHELQFAAMIASDTSIARALFAFNSVNVEGWALYAEAEMQPYMPLAGQLATLQFRLLRAGRAFLDPELQLGRVTPRQALKLLQEDMVFSEPMAQQELERYTFRAPGQAPSYFYGYLRWLELRSRAETALDKKFDRRRFHDFVLAQGLLPPELMMKAVMEEFVPAQIGRP